MFNQFTEQFSVQQLAELVQKAGAEVGLDVAVDPIENPRVEMEEHYYHATHTKLLDLGLEPHLLSETLIESMFATIERHKDRVITDHILPRDRWRPGVGAPRDVAPMPALRILGGDRRARVLRLSRSAGTDGGRSAG